MITSVSMNISESEYDDEKKFVLSVQLGATERTQLDTIQRGIAFLASLKPDAQVRMSCDEVTGSDSTPGVKL